ncbi:hypothetical protein TGAM01_v203181 [Trichoderma gamsii]|uniref:Uncharacterized protein n=1 Tax=Trichoderma gamsii TaxID=398673 RepID=A0A2P4ZUT4_9HYPO|nr:hypothetical protein TGAM01_v203181 [Trichoderma gamsii]PON28044.1 hypothetical protein TGAM01_v203181 [Trichoderma gamsii]
MDTLNIISLAGNAVQFVEYAIIAATKAAQIYHSPNGKLKEDAELESIANGVESSLKSINSSEDTNQAVSVSDETLDSLIEQCVSIAKAIKGIIHGSSAKSPGVLHAISKTAQRLSKQSELMELRSRLLILRSEVSSHLIMLIRQEQLKLGEIVQTVVTSNEDMLQNINDKYTEVMRYLKSITHQTQSNMASTAAPSDKKGAHRSSEKELKSIQKDRESRIKDVLTMSVMQGPFDAILDDIERRGIQKRETILQTLNFDQLHERELAVGEAHEGTATWIFDESKPTNFVKWLQKSNGMYWITGKAGSGKSTLMKFLTDHPQTLQYLTEWAKDNDLIVAKHYFWNPGTTMQKSQEGLFRALLHQILGQRPELIPIVCADRWNAPYYERSFPWTIKQLAEAFQRLGGLDNVRWRICLFIDGLDEYDGEPTDVIDIIHKIGESDKIKICISSRPWIEFSDAFGGNQPKLELQNFTRDDIQRFIRGKLQNHDRFNKLRQRDRAAADGLVLSITEKADGVFLWVFLVVRSLLRGLRNEDDILDLERRLGQLPDDLYKFFDNMLSIIEDVYRERVSRLFLTMTSAKVALPIITFYFLNFGDAPLSREPLPFLREWPIVDNAEEKVLEVKKRQLIAQCKDLIHTVSDVEGEVLFAEKVEFIHNMVLNFLHLPDINERLSSIAGRSFHPVKVLFKANIVRDDTAEIEALDELEEILTEQFKMWSFSHAMEYLFGIPQIESFLELACRCDLALYISQKYPDYNSSKLNEIAPNWKMLFRVRQQGTFVIDEKETKYDMKSDWRLGRHLGLLSAQTKDRTREESHRLCEEEEPDIWQV